MAAQKLTDQDVRKLKAPAKGAVFLWDQAVRGFAVKATRQRKTFIVYYRTQEGRQRVYGLGLASEWPSVAAARDEAARIKRKVLEGGDPSGDKLAARAAPDISQLCDRFEKEYLPSLAPSTALEYQRMIARDILPRLGALKVSAITNDDVLQLHQAVTRRAPRRANATVGLLRIMLNQAIKWRWITQNVAKGIKFNREIRRERYLTPVELQALARALAQHPDRQAANAIRLLMLTGARRSEVLGAQWGQFDFAASTWLKAASETKQRKSHLVPLPAVALQLLALLKSEAEAKKSPFVFPSHGRLGRRVELKKDWHRLCLAAGITTTEEIKNGKETKLIVRPSARLHDLRHSYASILVSSGLTLPIIGALLGHSSPATTSRYAHLMLDPLKKAAETATAIIEGLPAAEVIPLKQKQPTKAGR